MMGLVLAICMGSCSSWQGPPTRERKETPAGAHGGKTWLLGKMQVGSWPILTPCRQGSGKLGLCNWRMKTTTKSRCRGPNKRTRLGLKLAYK